MKFTNKKIIEECLQRIEVLQTYISTIDSAISHLSRLRAYQDFSVNSGNLRSSLVEEELNEWRKLFMWGLTIDQPTRDRIKAAAYERFLGDRHTVSEWLNPHGYMAGSWLSSDDEEFRAMTKAVFSPAAATNPGEDHP